MAPQILGLAGTRLVLVGTALRGMPGAPSRAFSSCRVLPHVHRRFLQCLMVEYTFLGSHNSVDDHCCSTHADGKVAAQQVRHVCRVVVTTDDVRHAERSGTTYHTASVANSQRHHQVTVAHLQWLFTQVSICKCYKQFVKLVIFWDDSSKHCYCVSLHMQSFWQLGH